MSEKLKNITIVLTALLLLINAIIGIALISINAKKSQVLTSGVSAIVGNVGLIEINGPILLEEDGMSFSPSAKDIAKNIKTFADSPNIKAIRIDITSPGGSVSAAETILSSLDYAKSKGKKIVVFMREIAASGGYYVSVPADYIIASRGTITGSIGVIVSTINLKGLFEKIGIKPYTFKSGEFKDILSPYRDISEPEKKLIQKIVDTYYKRFIEVILKYRGDKIKKEELMKIADGRIIIETEALETKLIDEVGDESTVEETLKKLTGDSSINYVKLPKSKNIIRELLRSISQNFGINSLNFEKYPRALYLIH